MQISKELFEAVQNRTNVDNIWIEDDHLHIEYINSDTIQYLSVNDFYFQCKQWALKHIIDKEIQSTGCIISSWTHPTGKGKARILVIDETFIADTEVEAVIKACEWIMERIK